MMKGSKNVTVLCNKLHTPDTMIHRVKVSPRPSMKRCSITSLKNIKTTEPVAANDVHGNTENDQESIGCFLRSMAETSSIHGVSRVSSSGSRHRRMLWLLFIITFLAYFMYQFYVILAHYYSYPIKTSLTLESRPLLFPAITICNSNSIKISAIKQIGSRTMKRLLEVQRERKNGTSRVPGTKRGRTTFDDFIRSTINISSSTVYDTRVFNIRDLDDDVFIDDDVPETIGGDDDESLSGLYVLAQKLQQEYDTMKREKRVELGHDIKQMLLLCTVAGRPCKWPTRTYVFKEYGNCYTFESRNYVATKSGPDYGIHMTLNLENHEALPHLTQGYGARLVIHQPGSFPLPAEEGITLSSGYETSIGIHMTRINRLGLPHGKCADPKGFFGGRRYQNFSHNVRYSSQVCLLDCTEKMVEDACGCFTSNIRSELSSKPHTIKHIPHCASSIDSFRCATRVTKGLLTGTTTCFCPNACNETVYSRFFSGRLWPSQEYLEELMEMTCEVYEQQNNTCPIKGLDADELMKNFLKINIYYEDLNFQSLTEEPEYGLMNLLSDVGGSLGLFLGASVLSVCELLEILVELIYCLVKQRRNRTSA